jgi:hypothetical protein
MHVFDIKTDMGPREKSDGNDIYCRLLAAPLEVQKRLREDFRGKSILLETWQPFTVVRDSDDRRNLTKPLADRAGINAKLDPMVLSDRALEVLLPHIAPFGQVLPIHFAECNYSLFNITNVVDALDVKRSEIEYILPTGSSIYRIKKHVFKPEIVRDQLIFKIPQRPGGFAFCTDHFVKLVQDAKLTGFDFEELWSDEVQVSAAA